MGFWGKNNKKMREDYIEEMIQRLGPVQEFEDKICVIVDKFLLDDYLKQNMDKSSVVLENLCLASKNELEKFGLNKKIVYVFKSLNFFEGLNLEATNCDVVFLGCEFFKYLRIDTNSNVVFFRNGYHSYSLPFGDKFLSIDNAKKVLFKGEFLVNPTECCMANAFDISIKSDQIIFENSELISCKVNFDSSDVVINRSYIIADDIDINSSLVSGMCSKIKANDCVSIQYDKMNFDSKIESKKIILNDKGFNNGNNISRKRLLDK